MINDENPEWTKADFARSIRSDVRKRLKAGKIESGDDIAALRRFLSLSQPEFAQALAVSVATLRNWEQGRRKPHGSALALLSIAATHPRIILRRGKAAAA